jgi:hypothetical protein
MPDASLVMERARVERAYSYTLNRNPDGKGVREPRGWLSGDGILI